MGKEITKSIAAVSLIVFNLLDVFFTIKYIKYGPLEEANPVLRDLISNHPCVFAFLKIFLVTLWVIFLWSSKRKITSQCLKGLAIIYSLLMIFWCFVILNI